MIKQISIHNRSIIFIAFPLALISSAALAQTGPRLLLEPLPEKENHQFNSEFAWFANTGLDRGPSDLGMQTYEMSGRARFELGSLTDSIERAQPRVGFSVFSIDLSDDGDILSGRFTDVSVGASIGIFRQDNWVAGVALGVGYASANVFNDGNALYYKADLGIGYTIDDRQTIGVVVNYDGNRSIFPDVPLPGFQYTNRHSDQLTFSLGFPFTGLIYRPDGKWTMELSFAIPDNFAGKIDYAIAEEFGVFAELTNKRAAFHWNDLPDGDDRILFMQSRAEFGVRGTINDKASFVIAGGYAFRQKFEVGFDSRDADTVAKVDPSAYCRVGFEMRF